MTVYGEYALITGSSRGIGLGIALKLAEQGVKIAINYYQNEAAPKDTLAKVRERGSDGIVVQADVCRPDEITHMFRKVKDEFGALDIFVSNARTEAPTFISRRWNRTSVFAGERWSADRIRLRNIFAVRR